MRPLILAAAAFTFALGACGGNDQADKNLNLDENLTADSIVSNDVTAIDAVTADAANMAADVDYSDSLDALANNGNEAAKPPAKSAAAKPAARPQAPTTPAPVPPTPDESVTNAQ